MRASSGKPPADQYGSDFNYERQNPNNVREVNQNNTQEREIRILGKISRVHIEGNDLYQELTFDPNADSVSDKKKKVINYIIVPIKHKNSAVEFIKVPVYKLSKKPQAKKIGSIGCSKLNFPLQPSPEELGVWVACERDFFLCEETSTERPCLTELPPKEEVSVKEQPLEKPVPEPPPKTDVPEKKRKKKKFRCFKNLFKKKKSKKNEDPKPD